MEEMYKEIILDYYRNPRNSGEISGADIKVHDSNPVCGDTITIYMKIDGKKIKEIKFRGSGCVISLASVSMMCEKLEGKMIEEAEKITKEDIVEMLSIQLSPVRLKCAILGMHIMKKGIEEYKNKNK